MKISAVIIAKNEEKIIGDALASLNFCDEIIVINNNSSDSTKKVSEDMKATVYDFSSKDFSELRNFGLKKARYDYVFYLDADERVSNELKEAIKKAIEENKDYSAFSVLRKNFYLGSNPWPYEEKIERLFRKDKLSGWKGKLHESPIVEGKIGEIEANIFHFTHRDFESMLAKTIEWSDMEALTRFNLDHPKITWWRFIRVMMTAFFMSYIRQQGFRAGLVGILESFYQSFSIFITYAKLWELQNQIRHKNKT